MQREHTLPLPRRRMTFAQAKARYIYRYTMEHVPRWALQPVYRNGPIPSFYAPQYASDKEWYDKTLFPGDSDYPSMCAKSGDCYTTGQTWPLGQWLDQPYSLR